MILRSAFASYPHAVALKDGTVASDRVAFDFEDVPNITRAFRRMVRGLDFDLCEIALTTHAQAHAYGKPITALPVVLMRGFHPVSYTHLPPVIHPVLIQQNTAHPDAGGLRESPHPDPLANQIGRPEQRRSHRTCLLYTSRCV